MVKDNYQKLSSSRILYFSFVMEAMYLLTGEFATYGEFARNGINLALEEIN